MNSISSADFKLHIELMVDALKTKDRKVINLFKQPFTALMGAKYVMELLTASMHYLARTDTDTCTWVLTNYYDTQLYLEMRKKIVGVASQLLYKQGFIRGTDFKIYDSEHLWLTSEAQEYLFRHISQLDQVVLSSVIQVEAVRVRN